MSSQVPYTGVPSVQPSFDATPSVSSISRWMLLALALPMLSAISARLLKALGMKSGPAPPRCSSLMNKRMLMKQSQVHNNASSKSLLILQCLKGQAAVNGLKPYLEDLEKSRVEIGQNLSSPYAQRLYLHGSKSEQARNAFAVARHSGEEGRQYNLSSAQAVIESMCNLLGWP